jgi:hypothetical protein
MLLIKILLCLSVMLDLGGYGPAFEYLSYDFKELLWVERKEYGGAAFASLNRYSALREIENQH